MKCRYCGSTKLQKRGRLKLGYGRSVTRYRCKVCGKYVQDEPRHARSAKILLLDIETLPLEVAVWSPYQTYIQHEAILKDWCVLCWAGKWLFEPDILGEILTPKEAKERKDSRILDGIWKLMNEADIIVTQNGIDFDIKKLNARFIQNGFTPPSPYLNVDTKRIAKEKFGFTYNKLDFLGKMFGIGSKDDMEFQDWLDCCRGDQEKLDKMFKYCKGDVAPLLEDVYIKLLPWATNHPNLNIYTDNDQDCCRNCQSTDISWNTQYGTPSGLWQGWRCNACGAVGRGTSKIHKIKTVSIK